MGRVDLPALPAPSVAEGSLPKGTTNFKVVNQISVRVETHLDTTVCNLLLWRSLRAAFQPGGFSLFEIDIVAVFLSPCKLAAQCAWRSTSTSTASG